MVAKYQLIADSLRAEIHSGTYQPGDQLPTEPSLKQTWGVAIGTVRSALSRLHSEGLIEPDSPRGWFVRKVEHMTYKPQTDGRTLESLKNSEPWVQQILAEGREPSQTIEVAIVVPPPLIAERLRLSPGELTAVRKRVRSINGKPSSIADSYYPYKIVEGSPVLSPVDIQEGVSKVLTELGWVQCTAIDEIETRTATPEEQSRLSVTPGQPVAEHRATTFTAEGNPVRCSVTILPGDRHVIVYERDWDPTETSTMNKESS